MGSAAPVDKQWGCHLRRLQSARAVVTWTSRHVDAAMETVEVANKELKVEKRLRNIENRWRQEQLGFSRHRDTEVIPPCRPSSTEIPMPRPSSDATIWR